MAEEKKEVTPEAPEAPKAAASGSGLEPNVAALLAYLFDIVGGLIFFLIEKDNKFVRFAGMQSLVLGVANLAVLWVILPILSAITLGFGLILYPLYWLGYIVLRIVLMVKAYQNQEMELPVLGKIARNFIK